MTIGTESPFTERRQSPLRPPQSLSDDSRGWFLPLESLVLENGSRNDGITLDFFYVYSHILRKFPGPPCEALARTITYLQAIITKSPGFHPYIAHLPCQSLPQNPITGNQVAEALEQQLIRVLQNLFSFFDGSISTVSHYINICPAELIPRPYFVIPPGSVPPLSSTNLLANGIDSFNNGVSDGGRVWQSPSPESPWHHEMERDILVLNLQRCIQMISTSESLARTTRSLATALKRFPPTPLRGNGGRGGKLKCDQCRHSKRAVKSTSRLRVN